MAERNKPLVLNITRSKQSRQFILKQGGKFTVGQSGNNDLILYGTEYPKHHTLFAQKNGSYLVNIKPFISGEVTLGKSTLHINDLVKHDILPQKQNAYLLKLTQSKTGVINVGDTKIEFSFQHIVQKKQPAMVYRTPEYSWVRATSKSLVSDLLFKFIFLVVFVLNAFVIYGLKDYKVNIAKKFDIEKMPERLAKFIVKPPEELFTDESSTSGANLENAENADKSSPEKKAKSSNKSSNKRQGSSSRRGNPAASAGLLGLIGGTGSSSKTSSIVDALVDKGLITQLDDILSGGTNLKVGKGNTKDKIDPFDQLIGTGGIGGIDNIFDDMVAEVPQVTLKKKAKVDLIKPQRVSGSSEAMGQRSDQSIMDVVLSRKGQMQYIFEKYLKRNPNLRGKISIQFTIAANGFVKSAKVIEATIDHPQFQRELLALIKRLKFPPIPSGELTTIFPFNFSKIN
ncbi:TonB family protein [candidate division KSB1 bacterium]|nr:TonB family protein [candidate division KSB1 bacterium]MBL7092997.1 TonB family protein [candidate division KSB1 bacterium]